MKKWFVLFVVFGVLFAGCGQKKESASNEEKVIVMGTSADYKPFEFRDTKVSDEIIGFDVDLAKALSKELGYKLKIVDMEFSGLLTALQADKVDMVVSGLTPTEERKKNVDFSDIYYAVQNVVVVNKKDGIKQPTQLKGKTLGVQLGSVQEEKAKELEKTVGLKLENRNRIPELVQEMKANRFDAVMMEDIVAKGYLEKNKELTSFALDGNEEEQGSAIAFKKNSKLTKEYNDALKKLKTSGELDKLVKKWFGN